MRWDSEKWLDRSLAFALEEDRETLTTAALERHEESTRRLLRMATEIKEGEDVLLEKAEGRMELRTLLGLEEQSQNHSRQMGRVGGDRRPV